MIERSTCNNPFIKLDFKSEDLSDSEVSLTDLSEIITTYKLSEVEDCLAKVAFAQSAGNYVAGFIAYEAAAALDPVLATHEPDPSLAVSVVRCFQAAKIWTTRQSDKTRSKTRSLSA